MKNQLYQWNFVINGLIPDQVNLKRKVWLKKGELLLDKKGDKLNAYLLSDDTDKFHLEERITPYLRISCLISSNAPDLENGGGVGINSKEELGTKSLYSISVSDEIYIPEEAVIDIENYAYKFVGFIGKLHDKYIDVVSENEFIQIAMDYFYEAEKKFVYSNQGFINAIISMEALLNDGPADINYKISYRAAFLLSLCDLDPVEAFEKMKDFYNKRSKLVHGRSTIPDDPDRYLVSKYTRKLIIIFLILLKNDQRRIVKRKDRKQEILKEIDYAMFIEEKRKSLKKKRS